MYKFCALLGITFMLRVSARNFHPIVPDRDINFGFRIAQDLE